MKSFSNRPALTILSLARLAALWAGVLSLGWSLPVLTPSLVMAHGPVIPNEVFHQSKAKPIGIAVNPANGCKQNLQQLLDAILEK